MKTERLFYKDPYCRDFTAEVLSCQPCEVGYEVVLDRTAFYPEGGGQPADTGYMDHKRVTDVQEKDDVIVHYLEEPVMVGTAVSAQLDWERRFDLMQQHSGEHMVSGLIHAAYGCDNVGFHMGSDVVTIDFNTELEMEQLLRIEEEVNREIWKNREIQVTWPSPGELSSLPYRSKKELTGEVRIVTFPGVDVCACCGIHVQRTGEIGMVKILSCVRFRDGVRVEMISGGRVLAYLRTVAAQNHQVSVLLSAREEETSQAVLRLKEESHALKVRLGEQEEAFFQREAEHLAGAGDVVLFQPVMAPDSVRRLADAVMQTCGGRCAVFSENADGSWKYAMGEKEGDLRSLTKEMNTALNGRGGGKPFFVQGQVCAGREEISRFFEGQRDEK